MHFSVTCPACHTEFPVDSEKVPPDGVHAICSTCDRVFPVDRPEPADEVDAPDAEATSEPEPTDEADASGAEATLDAGPTDIEEESPPDASEVSEAHEPTEAESVEEFEQFFEPVLGEEEAEDSPGMEEKAVEEPQLGAAEPEAAVEGTEEEQVAPDADEDWSSFGDELTLTEEAEEEEEAQVEEAPAAEEPAAGEAPRFGQRDPDEKAARLARVLVQDIIAYNQELYQKALEQGSLEEDFEDEIQKSWEEYVERIGEEMATSTTYFKDALNEILAKGDEIFDGPP